MILRIVPVVSVVLVFKAFEFEVSDVISMLVENSNLVQVSVWVIVQYILPFYAFYNRV